MASAAARQRDPAVTSKMMAAVKHKDSKAELVLRRALFSRGLRYRLHAKDLPGKPDIVFRRQRVAVFVDGDFWHGNEHRRRGLPRLEDLFPTRTEWWTTKIRRNVERDAEVTLSLEHRGWTVLRVWESDVLASPSNAADDVCGLLREAGWLPDRLPDEAWKPPRGLTAMERAEEQDQAAGDRQHREVRLADGRTSLASVELKRFAKGRRVYAYLRWTENGRTVNRYIGDVTTQSRQNALRRAWKMVHAQGVVSNPALARGRPPDTGKHP